MGRGSVSSKFLLLLNIIYSILGVAIVGASIYFCLELTSLISLRNENHFKLDEKIYWINVLPSIFIISGVFVVLVSCCAFVGVMKKSRPLVVTNAGFQVLTIILLAGAATSAIKYADTEDTDHLIKVSLSDAFEFLQLVHTPELDKAYQSMEVKLQCCGSSGPTSYNGNRWKQEYPTSCCKTYNEEPIKTCLKIDELANSRKGCTDIAIHKVRIAVKVFAAAAIFTAFVGVLNLVSALLLTNGLSNRKKMMKAKLENSGHVESHRSHVSSSEMETLKMPLKV